MCENFIRELNPKKAVAILYAIIDKISVCEIL